MTDTLKSLSNTLAGQFTAGGVQLKVKEDSLIAPLIGELKRPMEAVETDSVEGMIKHTNNYFAAISPNPFTTSLESDVVGNPVEIGIEAAIRDLKPIAIGIIDKVRNSIIPAVNTIFEAAYKTTTDTVDRGGALVNIVLDGSENQFWQSPSVLALLANASEGTELSDNVVTKLTFPEMSAEDLIQRLNATNVDVTELLGADIFKTVSSVYNSTFNTGGAYDEVKCPRIKNLVGLLLAISLCEDIPENVSGVDDAGQYRAILERVVAGCALHLKREIEYTDMISKSGRLILKFPDVDRMLTSETEVVVNGFIYESWLEAGGSVDAIFGACVSPNRPRYGDDILELKPQLERLWVRRVGMAQMTLRDEFERVFCNDLRREIYNYSKETGLTVSTKGIEKLYDRSSSIDSNNCYSFARRVVVHCLFPDGDFLSVLEEVDNISKKVPGIELADAIDLAIIDWLVEWALSMVDIKRI